MYKNIRTWNSLIAALLVLMVLAASAWYLYDSRLTHELDAAAKKTKNEVSLISILVQERLQKRNYQLANSFIANWGLNNPEIVAILLTTENGFELAHYSRTKKTSHKIIDSQNLQYSYDSQATLTLERSLDSVYSRQREFLTQLISGYLFISVVLLFFVFSEKRIKKQKYELIVENNLRIKTEKLLKDKEQNLSVTLNSIGDAVIVTDTSGFVTRMNPVAEQLTGWDLDDALGKPLKTIFPIIDATTRQNVENPIEKVIATGETIFLSNHTTLISKDGTEHQITDSAAPIRDDGQIIGMILVFNDVTMQYQLRQTAIKHKRDLQAIMDHSPAIIYVKDREGKYTFVNHQFEIVFQTTREEIIGKSDSQMFSPRIADKLDKNDESIFSGGTTYDSEDVFVQNDIPHTYMTTKFPLLNEAGKIYALCGISTDVTDHRHQEEQLRRSQKMDALGKLTGGIAHDYNNILGIIQGYAELLNDQIGNDTNLSKYTHDIQYAADRGAKLTKKLLSFSQLKTPNASTVNINRLLQEQRLMLEKTLTARINLTYLTDKDLWPINVDAGDLEDAIINITINAMHAMPSGGQLTFRTSNEQLSAKDARQLQLEKGDYVLLSITDNGTGIDRGIREKIFDPFFTTKGNKGTGLGLSQVYGFVERSGGAIKVYSEPGHGSRFAIYFPRDLQTINAPELPSINISGNLRGTEKILVVDDEHAIVELTHYILSNNGYTVFTANDGLEALELLKREKVDLVLSDVIMPNMDGYELAGHVQKHYPGIKIQMVSGFADNRHNSLNDDKLHRNMLFKPYTSKSLLARIRKTLDETNSTNDVTNKKEKIEDTKIIETKKNEKEILKETEKKTDSTPFANKTILIMDDDDNIRELFRLNLTKLGYKTILTANGEDAIAIYQNKLNSDNPIDVAIMDLSIPGGLGGKEAAQKILAIDPKARLFVASGHSGGPEMVNYNEYGFIGAIEKSFDRRKIKSQLEEALKSPTISDKTLTS